MTNPIPDMPLGSNLEQVVYLIAFPVFQH